MSRKEEKQTITRIYELLEARGGMTACAIAELLQLRYACVYATIRRARRNGCGATARRIVVRNAPLLYRRRMRDMVFEVERFDQDWGATNEELGSKQAMLSSVAGIDRWLEVQLHELRKERGNPFGWWLTQMRAHR